MKSFYGKERKASTSAPRLRWKEKGVDIPIFSDCRHQPAIGAHAFLKDAPIILLDEATASLDVEKETFIQESMSRLVKDKTVIIIAHRMRTVAGADKIVVLKEGRVAECGTPADLTVSDGFYKKMQDLQQGALGWNL